MLTLVLFVSCPNKWPNACEYLCERKPYSDFTYGEHQDLIFRMIFFFLPESLWRSKFLFKMIEHMFCKEKCELAFVHQTVGDTQVYLIADFSSFQKRARASPSVSRTILYILSGSLSLLHVHLAFVPFSLV